MLYFCDVNMEKRMINVQKVSTLFLKLSAIGMGGVALIICGLVLPVIYREWPKEFPDAAFLRYPFITALVLAAVFFFLTIREALKLLKNVDKNRALSKKSVRALRNIRYYAIAIGAMLMAVMPLVYFVAEKDDAPGLILFAMLFVIAPVVVGVFSGVLQCLIQSAVDIKSENDLTV